MYVFGKNNPDSGWFGASAKLIRPLRQWGKENGCLDKNAGHLKPAKLDNTEPPFSEWGTLPCLCKWRFVCIMAVVLLAQMDGEWFGPVLLLTDYCRPLRRSVCSAHQRKICWTIAEDTLGSPHSGLSPRPRAQSWSLTFSGLAIKTGVNRYLNAQDTPCRDGIRHEHSCASHWEGPRWQRKHIMTSFASITQGVVQ